MGPDRNAPRTCHAWPLGAPEGSTAQSTLRQTCWKGPGPARLCGRRERPGLLRASEGDVVACQTARTKTTSAPSLLMSQWRADVAGTSYTPGTRWSVQTAPRASHRVRPPFPPTVKG